MDFASLLGKALGMAGTGQLGGALADLKDYFASIGANALEKWGMDYAMGVECGVSRCPSRSFGRCDGCGSPTCVGHGRISDEADILCNACVAKVTGKTAAGGSRKKRPDARAPRAAHDPERLAALEVLGLPPDTTWPEVQARFRELSAKLHPDKFKDADKKAAAEKRYKAVTVAYETLKRRAAA
jgi:hypothetical protein